MIPKSKRWDQVYEWRNYRLACSLMNARKDDVDHVLDPFEIKTGWFELELVGFQVKAAARLKPTIRDKVNRTIDQLKLNDNECVGIREEYALDYWSQEIPLSRLERRAPFIAMELRRLGRLQECDT